MNSLDNITRHLEILRIEANHVGNKQMSPTQTAASDRVHVPQLSIMWMRSLDLLTRFSHRAVTTFLHSLMSQPQWHSQISLDIIQQEVKSHNNTSRKRRTNRKSVTVSGSDVHDVTVITQPLLVVGCKIEWTFSLKSEVLTGIKIPGVSHVSPPCFKLCLNVITLQKMFFSFSIFCCFPVQISKHSRSVYLRIEIRGLKNLNCLM